MSLPPLIHTPHVQSPTLDIQTSVKLNSNYGIYYLIVVNHDMGLNLWIVPRAEDARMMEKIMRLKPGNRSVNSTSYPKVYPHITLASLPAAMESDLEAIRALIPTRQTPLSCRFAGVDIGNAYFRSVYIRIDPNVEILDLHTRVHENLGKEPRTPAFPHLSLVYVADEDAEKGERMAYYDLLKEKGIIGGEVESGHANGVSLNCGFDGEGCSMNSIDASEVWVVKCEGSVEGWSVLAKIDLLNK